jgi:hypothetical protein
VSTPGAGVVEYEALRREATTSDGARGPGLTLVLARGLPAWLAALTALGPPVPARPIVAPVQAAGPPPVQPAARRELTTVLAGMVLACARPVEAACPPAR